MAKKKKETPEVAPEVAPKVDVDNQAKEKRAPQMVTVNGDKVSNLHVFKSDRSEDWFIAAKINDVPLKPKDCSKEDCEAIMTKKANVEHLMEKYYPTKIMPKLSAADLKLPATLVDNGKELTIEKFNVYKEKNQESRDYGKYKVYAQVGDKKMSVVATPQMLDEYFDRVKTPAQLVTQAFGEQLNLKAYYEQFKLPEGVDAQNVRIQKNKETNRYEISVNIEGLKSSSPELSYPDRVSYFQEKTATKEQLAAKYLGGEIPQMQAIMSESKKNEMKQTAPSLGL